MSVRIYLDCCMGAAGDMLMAALYELLPARGRELFVSRMNGLGLKGVEVKFAEITKSGVRGTRADVSVDGARERTQDVTGANAGAYGGAGDAQTEEKKPGSPEADYPAQGGSRSGGNAFVFDHEHETGHKHEHNRIRAPWNDIGPWREHERIQDGAPQESGGEAPAHGHFSPEDIRSLISGLELPDNVKDDALSVFTILIDAETAVHGAGVKGVHLHEVGGLDAVADIVGCCLLIHMLGAEDISASPVHVGAGFVRCSHGVMPVPAPATAHILMGAPIYGGDVQGELCTPTGAALLRRFVGRFGAMEPITASKVGYGMGSKEFDRVNCLRAFLSDSADADTSQRDEIVEIVCNLDDMTPEATGAAVERILEGGALDVFTTPVYMKKNRPAVMLTCLCRPEDRTYISELIFRHTTTNGLRIRPCAREKLRYTVGTVETEYGRMRIKRAAGFGVNRSKPEYDDVLDAARRHDVPFQRVYDAAVKGGRE
jgi:uncharacterized protein (TIGR00299 family) protein